MLQESEQMQTFVIETHVTNIDSSSSIEQGKKNIAKVDLQKPPLFF